MQRKTLYEYRGVLYSISELVRMSGVSRPTLQRRLDLGLTAEEAMELDASHCPPLLSREDLGKQIPIIFMTSLPVLPELQPVLGKTYIAKICGAQNHSKLCRVFYIVQLENGKKLITYPGEFILAPQSCTAV